MRDQRLNIHVIGHIIGVVWGIQDGLGTVHMGLVKRRSRRNSRRRRIARGGQGRLGTTSVQHHRGWLATGGLCFGRIHFRRSGLNTAFDDICNLGFDAIIARHASNIGSGIGLNQLWLRHFLRAADHGRDLGENALTLCLRHRRVHIIQHGIGSATHTWLGTGLLCLGLSGLGFAVGHTGFGRSGKGQSTRKPTRQQGNQPRISHNNPKHEEPQNAGQLDLGKAKHKGQHRNHRNAHQQRHKLNRKSRPKRQNGQQSAGNSITKQTAQTKAMGLQPFSTRGLG